MGSILFGIFTADRRRYIYCGKQQAQQNNNKIIIHKNIMNNNKVVIIKVMCK